MEKRLKFSTSSLPFEFATAIGESTEVWGETRTCCPKLGPKNFYFWKQFMFVRNASSDFLALSVCQSLSGQVVPPFFCVKWTILKGTTAKDYALVHRSMSLRSRKSKRLHLRPWDFKMERLGENANATHATSFVASRALPIYHAFAVESLSNGMVTLDVIPRSECVRKKRKSRCSL